MANKLEGGGKAGPLKKTVIFLAASLARVYCSLSGQGLTKTLIFVTPGGGGVAKGR